MLVLWGGADIHPRLYGQPIRYAVGINTKRDKIEISQYYKAIRDRIPIFGICRGHQLIAALRGGALYQDMEIELGVDHYYTHIVYLENEFVSLFRQSVIVVNSLHHQAVSVVPEGGIVCARCQNGVVEAIYYPGTEELPPMLGVQWHPEMMEKDHFDMLKNFLMTKYKEWSYAQPA